MKIKANYLKYILTFSFLLLILGLEAQCPMCRMSAESNLANGGSEGAGLNKGILYLLSLPYLLVLFLGAIWYRNRKSNSKEKVGN